MPERSQTSSSRDLTSSAGIREAFLAYFEQAAHQRVASSSLVPINDPTLLFTNAGMVQFKDVFLGDDKRDYVRATSSQRCVRAGGKHNDLENVGYTARHHTFFEMLGNFSFGNYFKAEAIPFAWNFLTVELAIPCEKLWVTIYADDNEAFDIWHTEVGLSADRIIRIGDNKGAKYASDNFWSMGDTGPCGPCTEIFYDHGADIEGGLPGTPEEDGDRYIEIWNIVFMQFNRAEDGVMNPLPKPSVDTGMGLERIAAVMQGVHSNYEIDIFQHLIKSVSKVVGVRDEGQGSLRVIADHIRSCAFLITDGVMPSNEGRGYVLRRIIRRAVRHGNKLGANGLFFWKLVASLAEQMGQAYPELLDQKDKIESALRAEEEQFAQTLDQGMKILEQDLAAIKGKMIPGDTAFKLYDTYGFPLDLTADIARERGLEVDQKGYDAAMAQQRAQAKAASQFKSGAVAKLDLTALGSNDNTAFTGYSELLQNAEVLAVFDETEQALELSEGKKGFVVLNQTPFYAESGGQVGDLGVLQTGLISFMVEDTQKQGGTFLHRGTVLKGSIKAGDRVDASVNVESRRTTALNHSATHLLHAALREVLGDHVEQKGSLVDAERLRFDFSHSQAVSPDEMSKIVSRVNQQIRANTSVSVVVTDMESAKNAGAMALFGEKYGDEVRVLSMGEERFSVELCGGTHVDRTGDIGLFRIVSESGIAAGVRRIEGVTGASALSHIADNDDVMESTARLLKSSVVDIPKKLKQIMDQQKTLEKELQQLQQKLASSAGNDLVAEAVEVNGCQLLFASLTGADPKSLRDTIDQLKSKLGDAVVVLAAPGSGKIALAAGVTDSLTAKIKAGDLIKELAAALGGKGGGRADFAQGGGTDVNGLPAALQALQAKVSDVLA